MTTTLLLLLLLLYLVLLPSSATAAVAVSAETPQSSFLRGGSRRGRGRGLELSPPYWWSINKETDEYINSYNDTDNDNATITSVDGNGDGDLIAPSYYDDSAADAARGTNNFSDNDNDEDDGDEVEVSRKLGIVIFLIATIVSLSLITSMIVREYYFRLYGFDFCHHRLCCCCLKFTDWIMTKRRQSGRVDDDNNNNGSSPSPRGNNDNSNSNSNDGNQQQEQFDADRALAVELQRQLNEEDRETYRLTKRDERKKWYEYYMKDRCMVRT